MARVYDILKAVYQIPSNGW